MVTGVYNSDTCSDLSIQSFIHFQSLTCNYFLAVTLIGMASTLMVVLPLLATVPDQPRGNTTYDVIKQLTDKDSSRVDNQHCSNCTACGTGLFLSLEQLLVLNKTSKYCFELPGI
eukprot:scpid65306/ scgid9032/ 